MRSASCANSPTAADCGWAGHAWRRGRRACLRAAAALTLAGLLGACATAGGSGRYTDGRISDIGVVSPAWQEIAVEHTVFDLRAPRASAVETSNTLATPEVLLAQVRPYDHGQIQRLVLANQTGLRGENELIARLHPRAPGIAEALRGPLIETELKRVRLDDAWLAEQLTERFPAGLATSPVRSGRNGYGPYSYVVARAGAHGACHFAWQRLNETQGGDGLASGLAALDVELRYCVHETQAGAELGAPAIFDNLRLTFTPLPLRGRYATGLGGNTAPAPDAIQAFGGSYGDDRGVTW